MVLTDLQGLEVSADFAEADAVKVKVGQSATTTFSALTDSSGNTLSLTGTVESVAVDSTVSSNVVEYAVTVSLNNPPSTLKVGQTANVSATVASRRNVLAVASSAVTTTGPVKTVKVLRNGQQQTVTVTTGLVGDSATEITSGLSAGEQVVQSTSSGSTSNGVPGFRIPSGGIGGGLGG